MSLTITSLVVSIGSSNKPIIDDISLTIPPGNIVGLMGPNGSGKSTLAYTLMGHPRYVVERGTVLFHGMNLLEMSVDQRARAGIFLSFQQPPEVPGVSVRTFFHEIYRAVHGKEAWIVVERRILNSFATVGLASSLADRSLHEGFSGGERKRLEAAQLLFLKPQLAILDELDAGLDLDAMQWLQKVLALCKAENPQFSALVISHTPMVMQAFSPETMYIIRSGKIVAAGDGALVARLQEQGYDGLSL